jgi:hypothetical protein
MKAFLTIVLIQFTVLLYSQNWTSFNKNYRYNYSLENESYTTVVIFADSVLTQGTDTIYSLNRIAAKCDSCFFYYPEVGVADSNYVLINQPQFMQRRIIYSNNAYRLSDTSNYIIPRFVSVGNTWMFNTSRGITAQVVTISVKINFGVNDSIRTIVLSTNDTIILSKQFGILKYPAKFGQSIYYKLRGIENKNSYDVSSLFGEKVPNSYDFFKLKVGVEHYYSEQNQAYGSVPHCDRYVYGKKTIINSSLTSTLISNSYIDIVKGCSSGCPSFCNYDPTIFPVNDGATTYTITNSFNGSIPGFYNNYNNQFFDVYGQFHILKFGKMPNNHFFKTFGESCFASDIQNNPTQNSQYSMFYTQSTLNSLVYFGKSNISNAFQHWGETYIEGYGLVNNFYPEFELTLYYCTSAIIDGTDTIGSLSATSINTDIENNQKSYSSYGPNPTKDVMTINLPFEANDNTGIIEVKDVFGKLVFQKTISIGVNSEKINLQNVTQGLYFVEIKMPHFQRLFKVVKE